MNNIFRVGDIIINNDLPNTYRITSKEADFVGEIVNIDNFNRDNDLEVKVLKCRYQTQIGSIFGVNSRYFKLRNEYATKNRLLDNKLKEVKNNAINTKNVR